jgi:PIN domain nuclease of toxin-antitoxin system
MDASAVLAYLRGEPGGERVEARLLASMMSSVNLAEVVTKLIDRGMSADDARLVVSGLGCEIMAVDTGLGLRAGAMRQDTIGLGLSLGDRVCLALAERERLPVVTADRAWAALPAPIEVTLIR